MRASRSAEEQADSRSDRPTSVSYRGGRVFISAHDEEYFRVRRIWRGRLAESHARANHGGSTVWFRSVKRLYDQWRLQEQAWYAQFGLSVPTGYVIPKVSVKPLVRPATPPELGERCPRICLICAESDGARISRYLAAFPGATLAQTTDAHSDLAPRTVSWCYSYARRKGGVRLDCRNCKLPTLLADQQFHAYEEIWNLLGASRDACHVIVGRLRRGGYALRFTRQGASRGLRWINS